LFESTYDAWKCCGQGCGRHSNSVELGIDRFGSGNGVGGFNVTVDRFANRGRGRQRIEIDAEADIVSSVPAIIAEKSPSIERGSALSGVFMRIDAPLLPQ
jgi:hypothetical protein